jgi:hypothetical protein
MLSFVLFMKYEEEMMRSVERWTLSVGPYLVLFFVIGLEIRDG